MMGVPTPSIRKAPTRPAYFLDSWPDDFLPTRRSRPPLHRPAHDRHKAILEWRPRVGARHPCCSTSAGEDVPNRTGLRTERPRDHSRHGVRDRNEARRGDKYVTAIIDLTPIDQRTGPARLLDTAPGRSKQAFNQWLKARPKGSARVPRVRGCVHRTTSLVFGCAGQSYPQIRKITGIFFRLQIG